MSYELINFENKPSKKTPVSAENLNHMDNGIKEAHDLIGAIPGWSQEEEKPSYTAEEVGAYSKEQTDELLHSKANAIITKHAGKTILTTDSANSPLVGMKVFGKSWLEGGGSGKQLIDVTQITYDEYAWAGVVPAITGDGNLLLNGTATSNMYVMVTNATLTQGVTYTLSCNSQLALELYCPPTSKTLRKEMGESEITFTFDVPFYIISIVNASGTTFNSVLANIMLNEGSEALPWEAYTGGVVSKAEIRSCGEGGSIEYTLTDGTEENVQSLILQTPNGLNGLPVSSGGNWTDATGKQYLSDVIDLGLYKRRQRIGIIENYTNEDVGEIYISTTGDLSEGAKVLYVLDEPIATDLTEEEIAQYKALLMNYPNNTIINDAGAYTEIEQVCDTQEHIKQNYVPVSEFNLALQRISALEQNAVNS